MERITSRQNPIVRRFRTVARGEAGDPGEGAIDVLLDGTHLLQEALAARLAIEAAAFAQDGDADRTLVDAVARAGGRTIAAPAQVIAAMSPVRQHTGVVAIAKAAPAMLDEVFGAPGALVLALAGIQDPGNVGAIVRTAAAAGATGVVAMDGSADPYGWKALRGAMGGTFRLPVARRATLDAITAAARTANCRLIAAVPRGGTPLPRVDLRQPCALLLGAEGGGLDATLAEAAEERVTIPMARPVESLNVAVAAALLLYEAARQRGWLDR